MEDAADRLKAVDNLLEAAEAFVEYVLWIEKAFRIVDDPGKTARNLWLDNSDEHAIEACDRANKLIDAHNSFSFADEHSVQNAPRRFGNTIESSFTDCLVKVAWKIWTAFRDHWSPDSSEKEFTAAVNDAVGDWAGIPDEFRSKTQRPIRILLLLVRSELVQIRAAIKNQSTQNQRRAESESDDEESATGWIETHYSFGPFQIDRNGMFVVEETSSAQTEGWLPEIRINEAKRTVQRPGLEDKKETEPFAQKQEWPMLQAILSFKGEGITKERLSRRFDCEGDALRQAIQRIRDKLKPIGLTITIDRTSGIYRISEAKPS